MKKTFIVFFAFVLFSLAKGHAQSGFQAGTYYQSRFQISESPVSQPWREYDYYGRSLGVYQWWHRAVWHRETGGQYVNLWNGYQWYTQWYSGYYYWYEWVDYKRYIGY